MSHLMHVLRCHVMCTGDSMPACHLGTPQVRLLHLAHVAQEHFTSARAGSGALVVTEAGLSQKDGSTATHVIARAAMQHECGRVRRCRPAEVA